MSEKTKGGRWRLTLEQINIARRLRFDDQMGWRKIGERLGCNEETVQRAIDPDFEAHKRMVYRLRKERLARLRASSARKTLKGLSRLRVEPPKDKPTAHDEEFIRRRAVLKADQAFSAAMNLAIRAGAETASVGVVTQASSPDARFHPARGIHSFSLIGSSSGLCADF